MTHDAVRLTEYFGLGVQRNIEKDVVRIGDPALGVGLADDDVVLCERAFIGGRFDLLPGHSRVLPVVLLLPSFRKVLRFVPGD